MAKRDEVKEGEGEKERRGREINDMYRRDELEERNSSMIVLTPSSTFCRKG